MGGPIPVFAFVFAAFAATSAEGRPTDALAPADGEPTASHEAQDLFLTTWRKLSPQGGNLRVKVRVVVGNGGAKPTLTARGPDVEELWLGEIVETRRGFSGVPVEKSRQGQPIGFELRHIRGWTLDVEDVHTPPAAGANCGPTWN